MKLKLTKRVPTTIEVDITFPLYFEGSEGVDGGIYDWWVRIFEDGSFHEIIEAGPHWACLAYELRITRIDVGTELAKYVGEDSTIIESSEEEFTRARGRVQSYLNNYST
jgi:hypothetical protein